jgi:hypothetical protein
MSLLGNDYIKEYNIEEDLKNEDLDITIKNRKNFKQIYWDNNVYKCLEAKHATSLYKLKKEFDNLKSAMNWLKEE